jgi:Dihaem cytochrome c
MAGDPMKRWAALAVAALALLPIVSLADDDHDQDHTRAEPVGGPRATPEWAAYQEECGACHLAYPPGMLPRRSWDALMGGLADHFGQNAELDPAPQEAMRAWLSRWAAESGSRRRSRKILRSLGGSPPLRITDSAWWRKKHDEVPEDRFARTSVGTRANCGACHPDADQGEFDDDRVKIPRNAPAPR